jgi:hypothetical protein
MRVACLSYLAFTTGCSTMSVRTGLVVVGGHPAFQASIEVGASTSGERHGLSATFEVGAQTAARTEAYGAVNLDHYIKDRDAGPVARIGVRLRGPFATDPEHPGAEAWELRGTAFTGLARDRKTGSGGFGVEVAGGIALDPQAPILEANIVLHRRRNLLD